MELHPENGGRVSIEVIGYNTYDPATGSVRNGKPGEIDAWMIDTVHNRQSFYSHLIYLPAAKTKGPRGTPDRRLKGILNQLKKQAAPDVLEQITATRSQPFTPTPDQPVAVKIVTTTGAEMTSIIPSDEIAAVLDS